MKRRRLMGKSDAPPACHPDREYRARNMCKTCYNRWWRKENFETHGANQRAWVRNNPDKRRAHKRKFRYGVEATTVQAIFDAQGGLCKICIRAPANHLDHDHATGKTRSLLCGPCNRAIGLFKENADSLKRAAAYIEYWAAA